MTNNYSLLVGEHNMMTAWGNTKPSSSLIILVAAK